MKLLQSEWVVLGAEAHCLIFLCPCGFLRAAVPKCHKLGGLKQLAFMVSQLWRPEVWNEDVGRAMLPGSPQSVLPQAAGAEALPGLWPPGHKELDCGHMAPFSSLQNPLSLSIHVGTVSFPLILQQ